MFDRTMHEWAGVERPAGDPTRAEQLRMYEAASGRVGARRPVVRDLRGGALLRDRRAGDEPRVDRGLMPEDHTIWLENPASAALESLLAEL